MPKITSLTQGSPLLSDILIGVDVTDTSMASTGTTKKYNRYDVCNQILSLEGVSNFSPALVATTANLNATYSNGTSGVGATLTNSGAQTAFSVDGVSPAINSIILVKDQSSASQNGIYILTTVGNGSTNWVLTRSTSADQSSELTYGKIILVAEGVTNANTSWQLTFTGSLTIGSTSLNFAATAFGTPPYLSLNGSYSLGGIVYSTATQGSILAGTSTASQMLQSGASAAPSWSTATWPSTTTSQQLLYSSATNTVSGLPTSARATLASDASGNLAYQQLFDGQLLIGSTAGSPAGALLTAGVNSNIAVASNSITINSNTMTVTPINNSVSPYTALSSDYLIWVDTAGGAVTIKLPNAPTVNQSFIVKDATGHAGSNNITITTVNGTNPKIDNSSTYVINSNFGSAGFIYSVTQIAYAVW